MLRSGGFVFLSSRCQRGSTLSMWSFLEPRCGSTKREKKKKFWRKQRSCKLIAKRLLRHKKNQDRPLGSAQDAFSMMIPISLILWRITWIVLLRIYFNVTLEQWAIASSVFFWSSLRKSQHREGFPTKGKLTTGAGWKSQQGLICTNYWDTFDVYYFSRDGKKLFWDFFLCFSPEKHKS